MEPLEDADGVLFLSDMQVGLLNSGGDLHKIGKGWNMSCGAAVKGMKSFLKGTFAGCFMIQIMDL